MAEMGESIALDTADTPSSLALIPAHEQRAPTASALWTSKQLLLDSIGAKQEYVLVYTRYIKRVFVF